MSALGRPDACCACLQSSAHGCKVVGYAIEQLSSSLFARDMMCHLCPWQGCGKVSLHDMSCQGSDSFTA